MTTETQTPASPAEAPQPPPALRRALITTILVLGVVLLTAAGAMLAYRAGYALVADLPLATAPSFAAEPVVIGPGDVAPPPAPGIVGQPTPAALTDDTAAPRPLFSAATFQPYSDTQRLSILLMGNDVRCEEEGPTRTDSLMLISVDPVNKAATALSIPRDLWVPIPGLDRMDRINQAYYWGEFYELPGGGPELAKETVENFLGVRVDHFVTIDFEGFVEFIDLIGGIDIEIPETIDDPNYPDECYGFAGFYVEEGWYEGFDGQATLKYARTRVTSGGDIDRAARQQLVLLAIRDKILRLNMLPQLIGRSGQLWQTFTNNVSTTLSESEVIQLALLLQEIPRENIDTAVIDYGMVYERVTPDGRNVLLPIYDEIGSLRRAIFPPIVAPRPSADDVTAGVAAESARVRVLNGTSTIGLAGETADYLESLGVTVVDVGDADAATYPGTLVIDYGNHPDTMRGLVDWLDVAPLNVSQSAAAADGPYDILVILGNGWRVP